MPDIDILIEELDVARRGLNNARNAAEQWKQDKVAGVNYTAAQRTALKAQFDAGLKTGKEGVTAVEAELQS